jgi:hypothetical protein
VLAHSVDEPPADRVRAAVLERAGEFLAEPNVIHDAGKSIVYCLACGRQARPGSDDVCTWWPFGCQTGPDDPLPRVCWACCTTEQRHELVTVGCTEAAIKVTPRRLHRFAVSRHGPSLLDWLDFYVTEFAGRWGRKGSIQRAARRTERRARRRACRLSRGAHQGRSPDPARPVQPHQLAQAPPPDDPPTSPFGRVTT